MRNSNKKHHGLTDRATGIRDLRREPTGRIPSWIINCHYLNNSGRDDEDLLTADAVDTCQSTWSLLPPSGSSLWPPTHHLRWFGVIPLTLFPAPSGSFSLPAHVAAMSWPISPACLLKPHSSSLVCVQEDRGRGHSSRLEATSESWPTIHSVTENGYRSRQRRGRSSPLCPSGNHVVLGTRSSHPHTYLPPPDGPPASHSQDT